MCQVRVWRERMEREDVMLEGENNRQQKDKDENEENKGDE